LIILAMRKARRRTAYDADNPTVTQAMSSEDADGWLDSLDVELTQMLDREVYDTEQPPPGTPILPSHFVLRRKRDSHGRHVKFKARLVAGGDRQLKQMYTVVTAPTAKAESIKLLYSIAAKESLICRMFDVTGAYLLADLDVPIYMRLPPDPRTGESKIVRLKKSLYGLKQAGALWRELLDTHLQALGCKPTNADPCVYRYDVGDQYALLGIHVDDILFATTSNGIVDDLIAKLSERLGADIDESTHTGTHLGIAVDFKSDGSISLSQPGYIAKMVDALGLQDAQPAHLPYRVVPVTDPDTTPCDQTLYRQAVGLLLFAAVHTRPDIAYVTSVLATHVSAPTNDHLQQAYHVVRYLSTTRHLGLTFSPNGPVTMVSYVDASYNLHPDAKGHSGIAFSLGLENAPFLHKSIKQSLVARSSSESEIAAVDRAVVDIEFFRALLAELGYTQHDPTVVLQDNLSSITIAEKDFATPKAKHFRMRYFYIKQALQEHSIVFEYLPTEDHVADILTKPILNTKNFIRLRALLLHCSPTLSGFPATDA
jgi:Reverse transcriptase (RNA-dependent DNA polymerase)